jgi:hypothetical protein
VPESTRVTELDGFRRAAGKIITDSTYSSKGHMNAGARLSRVRIWLGTLVVVLATLASAASFSTHLLSNWEIGTCALAAAAVVGVTTVYDPGGRASKHNRLGSEYLALKKDSQVLLDVDLGQVPVDPETLRQKLENLAERQRVIDSESSQFPIPRWAYELARDGIREGEARY